MREIGKGKEKKRKDEAAVGCEGRCVDEAEGSYDRHTLGIGGIGLGDAWRPGGLPIHASLLLPSNNPPLTADCVSH